MTYTASGTTAPPPITSICLRANWKMPGVMNRYIKHENAGDQYVGRCVSGRKRMDSRFAESIPYFDFSEFPSTQKETMNRVLDNWIKSRMPEGGAKNQAVFFLFKSCLASVVYHRQWWKDNLHQRNPVRGSVFMTEDVPFAEHVRTALPWTKTDDTPVFTGIPQDILLQAKIEELEAEIRDLKQTVTDGNAHVINEFKKGMEEALDDRDVGGQGYAMSKKLVEMIDNLSTNVVEKLDDLIEKSNKNTHALMFDGDVAEVTEDNKNDEENDIVATFEEDDIQFPVDKEYALFERVRHETNKQTNKQIMAMREKHGITVGMHNGHLNPLVATWRYPQGMNMRTMITMWLIGIPSEKVPPLRSLDVVHVHHFDKRGRTLNKMKRVMDIVKKIGEVHEVWRPKNARNYWNGVTVTKLLDKVLPVLLPYCKTKTTVRGIESTHKTRERSWRTNADKLIRMKNFFTNMDDRFPDEGDVVEI